MFKVLIKRTPEYLQDLFKPFTREYDLRDKANKLALLKLRAEFLQRSIYCIGAHLWNSLSHNERVTRSFITFKNVINWVMPPLVLPHEKHVNQLNYFNCL